MRGTPSCSTTSASLPIERRIWQHASADPTASPSGRACEVSRNRSRCSMCLRTSFNIFGCTPIDSTLELMTPFLVTFQKLIDSGCVSLRAVQLKIQLRWTAQVQTLSHFTANETNRRRQPLQRAFGFLVVALNDHENPRGTRIASEHHTAHAGQPNAGVTEFALHDRFNLLTKGLAQSFPMIFSPTLFHCFASE